MQFTYNVNSSDRINHDEPAFDADFATLFGGVARHMLITDLLTEEQIEKAWQNRGSEPIQRVVDQHAM